MKYFEKFPFINYPYYGKLVEIDLNSNLIEFMTTIDMNIRFTIQDTVLNNKFAYYEYEWKDDDTPNTVAYHYYGSQYYDWVVMLSNQATDWVYDFPMKSEILESYIESKYGIDIIESYTTILHYEDEDGFIIDLNTYMNTPFAKPVYIYDYENEQNEMKRKIKLLSKAYLSQLNEELDNKLFQIKNLRETNARY